jgi:mono/diheme cytochrome c family protein
MIRLNLIVLLPGLAFAQDMLTRGADLYIKTCASGYCHAPRGAAGSTAPRLAARGFDQEYIARVVRQGIPGTAMAGFGTALPRADMVAIVAYVANLNGITPSRNPAPEAEPEKKLPPDATRGRELFFDSVRGFGRCSTCHEADGQGIPVASPIAKIPASVAELHRLATPQVRTATIAGESFPVVVVSQASKQTKVYDLTSPPPVLRTFAPPAVTVKAGSEWRHESVMTAYADSDLQAILVFLRAVSQP